MSLVLGTHFKFTGETCSVLLVGLTGSQKENKKKSLSHTKNFHSEFLGQIHHFKRILTFKKSVTGKGLVFDYIFKFAYI
uniref:Uncharacterized protein n=1 Tax=Anguilla anguilla TaxID=7936 RepID=A0A0E9XNK2_ANGAN